MLPSFEQIGKIEVRNSKSLQDAEVASEGWGMGLVSLKTKITLYKRPKIGPFPVRPLAPLFSVLFLMARIKLFIIKTTY